MSNDIVERLLNFRPPYGWPEEVSTIIEPPMNKVAAAEILRLRADLASANEQLVRADLKLNAARAEVEYAQVENEKLRAALVETLDYIDDPYDEFYIEIGQLLESLEAAALKETGDE